MILPIKKKWFDMICSGEKKEEYREIKPYWTKRFHTLGFVDRDGFVVPHKPTLITLQNGYRKDAPYINVWVFLKIADGYEKWGAEPGKAYYVLEIVAMCAPQLLTL